MNHRYLCFTNSLLLLTLLYFSIQISRSKVHAIEYVLAFGLVVTIALSQLFWFHPIRGSLLHRIDALNAKVVVACFILYVLSYKFRWSFVLLVGMIFFSFYLSHYYSTLEWCSHKHVLWQGILHVLCFIATLYAFFPYVYATSYV